MKELTKKGIEILDSLNGKTFELFESWEKKSWNQNGSDSKKFCITKKEDGWNIGEYYIPKKRLSTNALVLLNQIAYCCEKNETSIGNLLWNAHLEGYDPWGVVKNLKYDDLYIECTEYPIIKNYTGHEINLYVPQGDPVVMIPGLMKQVNPDNDNETIITFPIDGPSIKVDEETRNEERIGGFFPHCHKIYKSSSLPEKKPNVFLIVSMMTMDANKYRTDLISPDSGSGSVRGEKGRILGTKRFVGQGPNFTD